MHFTHTTRGFTMIEVLVVMGLFTVLGGISLYISMDTYRGSSFRSDRDLLVAVLQRARAEAINNVCLGSGCTNGKAHGVFRQNNSYVLFQGTSSTTRDSAVDASFEASPLVTYSETSGVVFSQLSGTTTGSTIVVSDATGHSSTVTIGMEGQISWTN